MAESAKPNPPTIALKNPYLAAMLTWLVPGLGQWYQGRRGKGVLFFVCILGLFATGFYLGDGKNVFWRWINPRYDTDNFRLPFLAQFWVGMFGLPSLGQSILKYLEIAPVLGGFLAEPPLDVINGLHDKLSKFVDLGVVYTEVAGLLNILAIYDALEGPAVEEDDKPETPKTKPEEARVAEPTS